jgi:hypothetical protein
MSNPLIRWVGAMARYSQRSAQPMSQDLFDRTAFERRLNLVMIPVL